ncbi:hypothetical protein [Legionella cardiaca]|uniref:Uncharacterized protein n=1 Tax=Legionella cardiaca TaxID=1071983 RepID=A0ABY8ASJ5_9GAMM|nr:hypothetical protein [Legionella cardiaca]WED43638.1 hypothetical protein PXX05_02355 [Legionella cardiaca]
MSPIIFFADPGKDGDDLIAIVHFILQAKSAGVIPVDKPVKIVTTDEISCTKEGKQDPKGEYGLRALYLNMQLAKIKSKIALPPEAFPEIIAGPRTSYYTYQEEKKRFYHEASQSEAFYPTDEVEQYYSGDESNKPSCLLSPTENSAAWIKQLEESTKEGATLVSIAPFDAISDFVASISVERRPQFNVITMGYNKPYSSSEYEQKVKEPHALPYNARSTSAPKASILKTLIEMKALNIVSGSTRTAPKYDAKSWLGSFSEIMSRAYPLYVEQYSNAPTKEQLQKEKELDELSAAIQEKRELLKKPSLEEVAKDKEIVQLSKEHELLKQVNQKNELVLSTKVNELTKELEQLKQTHQQKETEQALKIEQLSKVDKEKETEASPIEQLTKELEEFKKANQEKEKELFTKVEQLSKELEELKKVNKEKEKVVTDKIAQLSKELELLKQVDKEKELEQLEQMLEEQLDNLPQESSLLSGIVEFMKHSKYQAFWPHDVVASLAVLMEHGNWNAFGLPNLKKEMLFTEVVKTPASQLSLRLVDNKTGVLIDSSVAKAEHDQVVGTEEQFFTYGKELDVIFFTCLSHLLAIEALPAEQKKQFAAIQEQYKNILKLKVSLFELKQKPDTDKTQIDALEKAIKSSWSLLSFRELQQQLVLQGQTGLSEDAQYMLGEEHDGFSISKFTAEQANGLAIFIGDIIAWGEHLDDKSLLDENLLKWIKELAETMQELKFDLTESMRKNLVTALPKVAQEKKLTALTSVLLNELRHAALPEASRLLTEEGKLGDEFARTGNSMLYAMFALSGHLTHPFPIGSLGMSEKYKDLLSLKDQSPAYREAFLLHLAIHDAGKGDVIKNAVKLNEAGLYFVQIEGAYYEYNPEINIIASSSQELFDQATAHVDHDTALEVYAKVGADLKKCSLTEFLLWNGPKEGVSKDSIAMCDELITLCNFVSIAQIVQGEIPLVGVKNGLDLFFEAYKIDPKKAELVFAHHCYDIFGAAPIPPSLVSITAGRDPNIHLKINLLYETLLEVAQKDVGPTSSEEAYTNYRKKLALAIPAIAKQPEAQNETVTLAKTRLAQMLRCHLFKTETNPETKQLSISDVGAYEARTQLFVKSVDAAFDKLPKQEQEKLVDFLNRNAGTTEKPAVMVMYGPKLLLTGTTGAEFALKDPTEQQTIVDSLVPMLSLYANLYEFQASKSKTYGVIDVNKLALVIGKVFPLYQKSANEQKNYLAELFFTIQKQGLAEEILLKLGDTKDLTDEQRIAKFKEVLIETNIPFVESKLPSTFIGEIESAIHAGDTKTNKQEILLKQIKGRNLTVAELGKLYDAVKNIEDLNTHRNPCLDSFFGIKNTTSWRNTLEEFRRIARDTLFHEVDSLDESATEEKIAMLNDAKKLPLFWEHRNNSVFTGAWGRTTALRMIDEKIASLETTAPALN